MVSSCRKITEKNLVFFAEDERNEVKLIQQPNTNGYGLDGLWADDFHHQVRVMVAKDHEGYFADFSGTLQDLIRTMTTGWFYTGQLSKCSGHNRGTDPSNVISELKQFVVCIQNHDQVGNRAMGERLHHQIDMNSYKAVR